MIRNISIGIDMGSATIRVVVGQMSKGEKNPKIIGVGEAPASGMRHGYVVNLGEAVSSVKSAVQAAEKTSGIRIKRAYVALSGVTLKSEVSAGLSIITKSDGEVTSLDLNKALEECEENLNLNNKKVIQVVPLSYRLDGKEVLGRLEGMRGNKLEVRALFITYSVQHLEDLLGALAEAGVEAIDIVPSGLSASYIAMTEKEKIVGGALVDIGAEKVSVSVFENGTLASMHTFSIGGADITNDLALGMKIPLETAESLKLGNIIEEYSKKKLEEIIEARLSDIFELIDNHLKKIKRSELLPAGIVWVGGGANIPGLVELSKSALRLPARVASTEIFGSAKTKLRDPAWFSALGLLLSTQDEEWASASSFSQFWKDIKKTLKSSIKQLMP